MVFTVRVRRADHGLSRRGVLAAAVGGLAALGLGACDLGPTTALWHPAPDVLLPFLASTVALADTYDNAIRTLPSLATLLTPLRDAHRQHVVALQRELGLVGTTPTPATPQSSPSPGTGGSASVPPTQAPTTPAPTSQSPTSQGPTSQGPTSQSPASQSPASQGPTHAPTNQASAPATPTPLTSATGGGPAPAGTPENATLPNDRAGLLAVLRTAEQKGQADATTACLTAPSYRAALLGSIAACRSTHLVVLV